MTRVRATFLGELLTLLLCVVALVLALWVTG